MIVDMNVGDSKPVRKQDMVPLIEEVNNTALIGHAIRLVRRNGVVTEIKKYRKTAIEKRFESQGL